MSNAAAAAIAQAIQGLAGAGSELADITYKDKLSQREAAARQAKLDALNKRTQEILDAQKASQAGTSIPAIMDGLGGVGGAIYSSLAPDQTGSMPLGDKVRMATTPAATAAAPIEAPAAPVAAPVEGDDAPLWQKTLDQIQTQRKPQVKPVVDSAMERTAAWMQAAQEQGIPAEEIQKMASSGSFLRDLAKDVMESGDKLTSEQNKTGMEYLQQTSMDKRQREMLGQQEEQAALDRALKDRLFKLAEAGKSARADTLANSWKAQVAAANAMTRANKADQDVMLKAIDQARKTRDPVQQAAILRAGKVPFDADSTWFNVFSDKKLKSVTPRMDKVDIDTLILQAQNEVMKAILKDGSYDPNSDAPDEFGDGTTPQQIVLPATVVDPGSTLPGANPKRTWLNP